MKRLKRGLLLALALALACALLAWREVEKFLNTPPERHGENIYFDIPQGAPLQQIAAQLARQGLVTDATKFVWLARFRDRGKQLQAGRFLLNTGWTPGHVLDTLVNGMPVLHKITIPEGLTWWQTARLLEAEGLGRYADFEAVFRDPDFLRHNGIPFATAEGFLMPDTYLFKKPDSIMPRNDFEPVTEADRKLAAEWQAQARSVAGRMVDNFWRKTARLWPETVPVDPKLNIMPKPSRENLKKWVILASIIEEETGVPSERARVGGVYANRLARNMLLQADPTVQYGLGPSFEGRLRLAHLQDPTNQYNTYYYPGLPPGPIASFGLDALKGAISPEKHDYLFFVATGDGGGHTFSRNFTDHSQAVREYRKNRQNR